MKLLTIGSSGQIGTAVITASRDLSIKTIGIDQRPNEWDASFTDVLTDFLNYEINANEGITDILFLTTEPSAKRLEDSPETNLKNYQTFEHAVSLAKKSRARLIMVSSRELFGLEPENISEFSPQNLYEKQKMDFEAKLYELQKEGLNTGVIRVPVVFGGYDTDLERIPRLVPRWCRQALDGKKIDITDGENKIELILADETAKKMIEALTAENASFVNDIRGTEISLKDLSELIYKVMQGDEQKNGAKSDVLRYGIKATLENLDKI